MSGHLPRRLLVFVVASCLLFLLAVWSLLHFVHSFDDNYTFSSEIVLHELERLLLDHPNHPIPIILEAGIPSANLASSETISKVKVCHDTKTELASSVHVVSLPNRADRRNGMEKLRAGLHLNWTYNDATPSDDFNIETLTQNLIKFRHESSNPPGSLVYGSPPGHFLWPVDFDNSTSASIDATQRRRTIPPNYGDSFAGSRGQSSSATASSSLGASLGLLAPESSLDSLGFAIPLTCATENNILGVPYAADLPKHMILTPAKLACWYSHAQIISRIGSLKPYEDPPQNDSSSGCVDVTLVLEDDVDMERDIQERLAAVWETLPDHWDILFLGHCWSDETHFAALPTSRVNASYPIEVKNETALHPSYAPKCTHAYALHPAGARKILQHLNYPPFAYSRALDQALAWLIMSGRITSYSVVPSLVVQRKKLKSDVDAGQNGVGSNWKEHLFDGVMNTLEETSDESS
ncbi:hypothetical protein QCA50_001327 [Cerrena zonata]|uniref:Glycosyltransferase family 25 protein n=1 Tax=Cerrena zonata TaxID=2478898 RepID=A0AAW0GNB4_9APHY